MFAEAHAVVNYEGETLSVLEKPPRDSKAVAQARDYMLGAVDMDGFLSNLVTVGKFIRIAYNGVAGDTELQNTMRELGFEIAELCDDSSLTIGNFRMTADSILTDMTGAYQFFLDEMEEMAITCVESIGDSAHKMADAAQDLCDRFTAEKGKVIDVCTQTAEKKGLEEKEVIKLKMKQKEMEAEAERHAQKQLLAAEEEKMLQKEIEEATATEEKLVEQLVPNAADVVLGVVSFGIVPAYRITKVVRAIGSIRDKVERLHKHKRDEVDRQQNALKDLEKCAKMIAQCSNQQKNVQNQAIMSLHGAVRALSNLAAIMQKAVGFWKSLQLMCEEQAQGKLEKLLDKAMTYEDPKKRLQVYRNPAMKRRAIKMFVSWAAMEAVCDDYVKKIKVSREELYKYVCETPTIEESKRLIGLLCREFSERIAKECEEMERKIEQEATK